MEASLKKRQLVASALKAEIDKHWTPEQSWRIEKSLDHWCGLASPVTYPAQTGTGIYVPGLPNEPWMDPDQFAFSKLLKERFAEIATEAKSLTDGSHCPPAYGLAELAASDEPPIGRNPVEWREWRIYGSGVFSRERCSQFPVTTKTIQNIQRLTPFLKNTAFLIMRSGGVLNPHCDANNLFVNVWLPLIVPTKCYLTVAGVTKYLEPCTVVAFNHSYLHAAGNDGATDRVLLSVSVLNPALTSFERDIVRFLAPVLF